MVHLEQSLKVLKKRQEELEITGKTKTYKNYNIKIGKNTQQSPGNLNKLPHRNMANYLKGIGLVGFYGMSNIVDYLMPNTLYTYIFNIYDLVLFCFMAYQPF